MIIIGYQGIGKSSCAKTNDKYIDLESSSFWVNGERDPNWYIVYAQVAEHLSQQGYIVFTSSHQVLRDYLRNSEEVVVEIYPSHSIKEDWINKLKYRYIDTPTKKNKRALDGAMGYYHDNINSFEKDTGHNLYMELRAVNYDLTYVIDCIYDILDIWDEHNIKTLDHNRFYYTENGNVFSMP